MTIFHDLWRKKGPIVHALENATSSAILDTWRRSEYYLPQEPDYIASLVLDSTPLIQSALRAILPRYKINVASVFCHQTPKVEFVQNANKSCELGDILFVYTHTRSGKESGNALLFQAKMAEFIEPHLIANKLAGDDMQLVLYRDWPEFKYVNSRKLTGQVRDVKPKAPHTGAQYLLIEPWLHESYYPFSRLECSMPDKYLHPHNTLGEELFELFTFQSGRAFEDSTAAAQSKDWSQVVWDLIVSAFERDFNRKRSGRVSQPRLTTGDPQDRDGDSVGLEGSKLWNKMIGDIENINRLGENDGNISIVLIEISEPE